MVGSYSQVNSESTNDAVGRRKEYQRDQESRHLIASRLRERVRDRLKRKACDRLREHVKQRISEQGQKRL